MRALVTEVVDAGEKRDRRGRRMTPREQRGALVQAYRASGLTQAAFARREGLNPKTLSHWLQPGAPAAAAPAAIRFARVSLPAGAPDAIAQEASLEVALPDGTRVRGSDARALALLVRALRD